MRKSGLAIFLMVGLLLGSVGCNSSDGSGAKVVNGTTETASSGSAEPAKAPAVGTRENPLPLGTTAKVGSWEIAITKVNTNANDVIAKANQFNEPPAPGNQYVLVSVTAKYAGEESGTFWTDMVSKFYGSKGNTFDQGGQNMVVAPNALTEAGETFPGASISGNLVFEVPVDQIEGGAVIIEEAFALDDTRTFFAIK